MTADTGINVFTVPTCIAEAIQGVTWAELMNNDEDRELYTLINYTPAPNDDLPTLDTTDATDDLPDPSVTSFLTGTMASKWAPGGSLRSAYERIRDEQVCPLQFQKIK